MNPIPLANQQPFSYVINSGVMAANSNASTLLILGMDSDFDFYYLSASTDADTAANVINNNFTLLLKDVTTGRDYMTGPVQRFNLAGVIATNVEVEARCIRFPKKQQLQFQFQNLTAGNLSVQIVLHGYKVFQGSIV
jgi:hypothetical protein